MSEQDVKMPPLVVDFEGIEDEHLPGNHFWFQFDNGYSASVLRVHDGDHKSLGYDEGKWEAVTLYRDEFAEMIGLQYGMPVFDTGLTPDLEGAVRGGLDNAGVAEFLVAVAALPRRVGGAYPTTIEHGTIEDEEIDSE